MQTRILTLRLKAKWWHQIASGQKTVELRRFTPHNRRLLESREYDEIHLWLGYPSKSEVSKRLKRKFVSCNLDTILHEEFGSEPVMVFVIDVSQPVD